MQSPDTSSYSSKKLLAQIYPVPVQISPCHHMYEIREKTNYCRDISIRIRSHLEIKRRQGDVITAFVAYRYKKNEKDKHKSEIDVYAANVVKDIFRMKLHGKSQDAIASELNSLGILPPAEYKASTGSNYHRKVLQGFVLKVMEQHIWM